MKKIIAILLALFLTMSISTVKAEETILVYPFDSITITSAYYFRVLVSDPVSVDSFLSGHVAASEELEIYVGDLSFEQDGVFLDTSKILIVSNAADEDIVRWVINGSLLLQSGVYRNEYSSHILVDPSVGIRKDLTVPLLRAYVEANTGTGECTFTDNTGMIWNSVAGSFASEPVVNIVISINPGA